MTPRPALAEAFVRALYPVMILGSLWILLRGHNEPGGGFIGGLTAAAASSALALVFGVVRARARIPLGPERLAALGVLVALASGLPALASGLPFLTHPWFTVPLGIAAVPMSSVLLFDLGVYLCVWGAVAGFCLSLIGATETGA
jgi:multisubunit Na+/H+ antiporter MnhB subunit